MNEFNKWWDKHDSQPGHPRTFYEFSRAGFLAGAAAMRERCAEYIEIQSNDLFMDADLHAAAIRGMKS